MSDVKRYEMEDINQGMNECPDMVMCENDTGEYVKASDFDALRRERDGLAESVKRLRTTMDALLTATHPDGYGDIHEARANANAALKASGGGEVGDG